MLLRREPDSVSEVVAVESSKEQTGRGEEEGGEEEEEEEEGEEAPDVSRSGKDMPECVWRYLLGSVLVQEHTVDSDVFFFSFFRLFF